MRNASVPRTMPDVRTARSLPAGIGARCERDSYVQLSQLARERHRLLAEREIWRRRLDRITRRLTEVDSQMGQLRAQVRQMRDGQRSRSPRRRGQEIEFPY
jgi:hypothetical protein